MAMNRSQRRAAKKFRMGMCINCGHVATLQPGQSIMCSAECVAQWGDLHDQLGDEKEALNALGLFATRWPKVSTDDFKQIVAISQRMEAKYPDVWPFEIEYHSDKGCWHYGRKGRKGDELKRVFKREEVEEVLRRWPSLATH
jgi:hypothetical protein